MLTIVSAPTNLGLRPPQRGSVPGTAKAPEALREAGLFSRLAALGVREAGVVLPGRYVDDDDTREDALVRNQSQLICHSLRLAERIDEVWESDDTPLVLGGDCSILVGAGVASARRGRTGLIHIDGHTDFRHPGNSDECASIAGEDLAAAVGLHWPAIADIDGLSPYFEPGCVAHIGHRDDDEQVNEASAVLGYVASSAQIRADGVSGVASAARSAAGTRYWLQIDVDVLDPSVMPAVDSPDDGGIDADQLTQLIAALAGDAAGISITVFDPDLDPDGSYARLLTDIIVTTVANV